MNLLGWLAFWTRLPEWFLKFEELKLANSARCHADTNFKNANFQRFMGKTDQKLLWDIFFIVEYLEMNTQSLKQWFIIDHLTDILH